MHLGSTAESLELLATADAAKVEFGEVDVSVIAEKCVANVSELMVQLNATIRVAPGMPKCLGWAHWIEVAMTHYMTSCLEHVGNGAQLTVFAREAETNDRVRYYIEHEGAPMNEAELQVLSREFAHSCSEPASGIGLDLVLAKHLTQKMGGSLGIENCRAQKSRFYLELKRYITPLALGGGGR